MSKQEILLTDSAVDFLKDEIGGEGQGGTGSNYVMAIMDYYQVIGKHIDVDSLIALLERYGVDMDAEISPQSQSVLGVILDNNKASIFFGYNVCRGGVEINIFDTPLENLEVAYTYRTILTANKEKIESCVITKDLIDNNVVDYYGGSQNIIINGIGNFGSLYEFITCEEALSIFK